MRFKRGGILGAAATILFGTVVFADSHAGDNPAVKARQAHMQLYTHNLGALGAMAKGEMEFNAEQAQAAADNLAALSKLNQMSYWPPGTSTDDLGDQTRALPVGWESGSMDDAIAKATALTEAAIAMQGAAGTLEGVQANIGPLGGACGGCHKVYRQPST